MTFSWLFVGLLLFLCSAMIVMIEQYERGIYGDSCMCGNCDECIPDDRRNWEPD